MPDQDPGRKEDQESTAGKGSEAGADLSRLVIGAACDLLGGVAQASADALQTVNSHISAQKPNLAEGILKGNARFLEGLSHTMDKVADRVAARRTGSDSTIFYPKP